MLGTIHVLHRIIVLNTRPAEYAYLCTSQYTGDLGLEVWDIGDLGMGERSKVDLVVGGLGLRGHGWIGLAERAGKYHVVNVFCRD
jgi:hypothetical protein